MEKTRTEAGTHTNRSRKNFLVYNASAGSGKTFTLVREYLRLALSGDNPSYFRRILAITFTRKAAAEMKERILDHLERLSSTPLSPLYSPSLLAEYKNVLGLSDEIIRIRAEKVLKSILHNYSDLSVSTIDSFVHMIIRTFARDLHLPMDFEVVMEKEVVVNEAVDRLVDEAGRDPRITGLLSGWLGQNTSEGDSWDVANLLRDFAGKMLFSEESKQHLQEMQEANPEDFDALIHKLQDKVRTFRSRQIQNAIDAFKVAEKFGLSVEDFSNGKSGAFGFFEKIRNESGRLELVEMRKRFLEIADKKSWFTAEKRKKQAELCDAVDNELYPIYSSVMEAYSDRIYFKSVQLLKEIHQVILLQEIRHRLELIKEERDLLFIDDFNKMISTLVMHDPAPFIYERVGERYSHIMIDEFQDTSVMQWHNFIPLVENALAAGNRCLIVGDGKQSIYRFRNGEVAQFAALPQLYKSEIEPILRQKQWLFTDQYEHHTLGVNYRSGKVIVDFNNRFFSSFRTSFAHPLAAVYDELKQEVPEGNHHGFVSIRLSDKEKSAKEITEEHPQWTLETIHELRSQGYSFSDICILVRTNREGDIIAGVLSSAGIQVVSPDSLLIRTSKNVQTVAGIIRWLTRPEDEENKGRLAELLIRKYLPDENFYSVLDTCSSIVRKSRVIHLEQLLSRVGLSLRSDAMLRYSLYQLTEYLVETLEFDRNEAFMNAFMDQVYSFALRENDLNAFHEWWEERKEKLSVQLPDSSDAVKVMTIHKSKGLQFPVVILPMLTWINSKKGKDRLWVELGEEFSPVRSALFKTRRESFEQIGCPELYLEEEARTNLDLMNLLYVAFTRPEEQLIIFSSFNSKYWTSSVLNQFIPELSAEQSVYTWGIPSLKVDRKRKVEASYQLKHTGMSDWMGQLRISYESQRAWGDTPSLKSARSGELLHLVLSRMGTAIELNSVMEALQKEQKLPSVNKQELEGMVFSVLNDPFLSGLFSGVHPEKREMEIVDKDGTTWRPDKVVFFPDKTVVVDFKTGKPRNEHRDQVKNYGRLLSEMGYPCVENYLFYTSEKQLEKVD